MITLDLPVPYSVNRTRKINWEYLKKHKQWMDLADAVVMQSRQNRQNGIIGPFHATITIDETRCRADPDNILKSLFDYCKRLKLITDDSREFLREFRVIYGIAPQGVRIELTPYEPDCPFVTGTTRRRLVEYLWKNRDGATTGQLADILYAGKERGDQRTIAVLIHHANKQLAPYLWRIRSTYGPGSIYRLERIEKAAPGEAA